jgi:hypothetical protein
MNAGLRSRENGSAMPLREDRILVRPADVPRGLCPCELPRTIETTSRAGRAQVRIGKQTLNRSGDALGIVWINQ